MKTLAQIEPSTPISSLPFTISNSGSYYLTTNLTSAAAANGIIVQANNVTIDLHGFALSGVAGSLNGLTVSSVQSGLSVFGGVVTGWGGAGVSAVNASGSQFEHLILSHNASHGLIAGTNTTVRHCLATANGGDGLELTSGGLAEDNNCQNNSLCGLHVLGNASRVEANHLGANGTSGLQVDGSQNLILRNSAINNGTTSYLIAANNDYGQILTSPGAGFTNPNPWANFASVPAPTCADGIKNGNETDMDCGGGTCPPCATGKQCLVGTDCVSGNCSGGVCVALLANGSACSSGSQCSSSFCVSGVCCNSSCPSGGGACSPSCTQPGSVGTCTFPSAATICAAPTCSGGTLTPASMCNGAGSCISGAPVNCAPYTCSGSACLTSCSADFQCASGNYCSSGACVAKKVNGSACSTSTQCAFGNCVDGFCCNSSCSGTCQACSGALTGGSNGTCGNVLVGMNNPNHPCSGSVCNGAGLCE